MRQPQDPRPVIEQLVGDALVDQLLQPERVTSILLALKARRDDGQASADRRIVDLARQASEAEERLGRLYPPRAPSLQPLFPYYRLSRVLRYHPELREVGPLWSSKIC
jgi:hypothetical protein